MDLQGIGRVLLLVGIGIVALGLILMLAGRLPFMSNFGNLPGDIRIERENFSCFFPVVSMILLSVVLTIILNIIIRIINRS